MSERRGKGARSRGGEAYRERERATLTHAHTSMHTHTPLAVLTAHAWWYSCAFRTGFEFRRRAITGASPSTLL